MYNFQQIPDSRLRYFFRMTIKKSIGAKLIVSANKVYIKIQIVQIVLTLD